MNPKIVKGATFEIFSRPNRIFKIQWATETYVAYTWVDEDSETYWYDTTPALLDNPELVRFL